jgi:hypothetical protein
MEREGSFCESERPVSGLRTPFASRFRLFTVRMAPGSVNGTFGGFPLRVTLLKVGLLTGTYQAFLATQTK